MRIDVKKELGVKEAPERLFIKRQGPDKRAAAQRMVVTESLFEEWFYEINRTNLRELPEDLLTAYEETATLLCKILTAEKEIITE